MGIFVGNDSDNFFQAYKEGSIFKTWEKWTISGNGGNDVLYGGEKQDTIYGGTGNDTLAGYGDNDFISGDVGNDIMYGGSGNDTMIGGEGNDYLYGMTGNDAMYGGLGDDIYEIDSLSDGVYENAAQGTDTVYSFVTNYVLPSNVENLYLYETGAVSAYGNELNNTIRGNSAANQLYGQAGNDVM
jgi:Ca2+-binding RTX toxin-like protein